jgi:hypothetical protein
MVGVVGEEEEEEGGGGVAGFDRRRGNGEKVGLYKN